MVPAVHPTPPPEPLWSPSCLSHHEIPHNLPAVQVRFHFSGLLIKVVLVICGFKGAPGSLPLRPCPGTGPEGRAERPPGLVSRSPTCSAGPGLPEADVSVHTGATLSQTPAGRWSGMSMLSHKEGPRTEG